MAWEGYFTIGDGADEVEIINVARTEAYAAATNLRWFSPVYNSALLGATLGQTYVDPAADPAPWYDPDDPASPEFFGFYPLDVAGIEDSSRTSDVVQSTEDGGIPGRLRFATKSPVFNGVLIASSARGAEYGFRWLSRAVTMRPCLPGALPNFVGNTLHYLNVDPSKDPGCAIWVDNPPEPGTEPPILSLFERTLRKFKVTVGPRPMAKRNTSDGGAVWNVQMTASAGPWEYGAPRLILDGMTGGGADPYADGIEGGIYDTDGAVAVDVACPDPSWSPIYSPYCPPLASPPAVPDVDSDCFDVPTSWWRYRASLPKAYIPLWGDAVPVVSITAPDTDVTLLRMRFWADLDDSGIPVDCTWIGDYVINYIPADTTLVFDGVAEAVYVIDPETGDQRRADGLIAKSDGSPFDWPRLTCGYGYIVTFDLEDDTTPVPTIDLSLLFRAS